MYKTFDPKEKVTDLEKRTQDYWTKTSMAQRSEDFRAGNDRFVFFEGPPTANGKPGIHHVMARTLKDTICRYKTMKGFQVKRKAGWDTHGLPVEIEVEKALGLEDKKDIVEYGVSEFNQKCRNSVFSYENMWREMTEEMGYWIDLDNPYITLQMTILKPSGGFSISSSKRVLSIRGTRSCLTAPNAELRFPVMKLLRVTRKQKTPQSLLSSRK